MEIGSMQEAVNWFRTNMWKTNTFPQQMNSFPNDGFRVLEPIKMDLPEEFTPRLHNPANETSLLHSHEEFVMMYMYSGECQTNINDLPVVLHTGDVLILSPHVQHSNTLLSKTDIMFHCNISRALLCHALLPLLSGDIMFSSFIMSFLADQTTDAHLFFQGAGADENVRSAFESLIIAYTRDLPLKTSYLRCLLATLFTLLGIKQTVDFQLDETGNHEINEVLEYIHRNYSHISLKEIAKEFHYHPNYLSSLIKSRTGKTFTEFITSYRLSRAYYLLLNTELTTNEVALSVGYKDLSSFYRAYKKYFGTTPKQQTKR